MDRNEETIFEAALQYQDLVERRAYVVKACGTDAKLQADVETLLQAHDSQSLLDEPVLEYDPSGDASTLLEGPGTAIGRYKLLEKIGAGGMAVVYMAEQQEPIRRKVALKIIKLGMDTRQVIARFEAERQALALMDHPSIAKVLEAGATETGRPYFVMELVTGVSITEYCDKNRLTTKGRLALFLQVCHAVQHAHQKGIIHRDIKPSNVMVTHHDGKPVPKVIDFGIAKATNQKLTEKTLFTRYAHIIGTPAYMSPEQAELSDLDIDTRSDIYSLGVLLYELLTGTTPFSEDELRKAGYIEMQRVIREKEPVKPSTKLSTLGKTLTDIAKRRNSTPDLLRKAVRGDLDWIVMKSLEKDRVRRYETANGLAEDIRRHLESEPVLARSPSAAYRLRKFLRRRRGPVLTAVVLAVVAGAAMVMLSQWNQDRQRLAEAEGFQRQAESLRDREILSQAQEQYAKGERQAALEMIQPIVDGARVGPEAQLLQAAILVDNRRIEEAVAILNGLLNNRPEVAGAAHALMARLLLESESLDDEKLKEAEEHRHQAETSLPETAEAYFLQAIMAVTVKEQLAFLNKALQLGPDHYESLRLRAFTHYASRKYDQMKDDALGMMYLRRNDPLGHSLRAIALRELGRYDDALEQYDSAIALSKKQNLPYIDLAAQRSETFLRMGDYKRAVADAGAWLTLWPDRAVFRHHLFVALTALGDYDKAIAVFEQNVRPDYEARQRFQNWCTKYVFDSLQAGQSWHPPDREPAGPVFLPMMEAEETYRTLSAKGHRVTTDGFSAQWSPDGKKLAFSLGVQGRSGVALFDPVTKETDLLIVPGKYPKWSPDGRYIAFVRDRRFLRIPEFVAADPKNQPPVQTDQEVWLMKSDGIEPRRLARGVWPSWGRDPNCVYFRSPLDSTLCSISIIGEAAEPKRIMACPGFVPSVSPDNERVAYMEGTSLKVKALSSQTLIAEWPLPLPSDGWGASAWSPNGNELCLGGNGGLENRTGLWIYRLGHSEPVQTLGGSITVGSWSADGGKLVFELGAPHFEIWTTDLAPNVSAIAALGSTRTVDEHLRELVALQTRRIEADPLDAYAYSSRAKCYDCLHERTKAEADMRRWSAVMSGRSPSDLQFRTPPDLRRVIDLPFDCELVFSAERLVNQIPVMSIAFGQKGRSDMKLLEIPTVVMSLLGFCVFSGLDAPVAQANFTFGMPTNLGPPVNAPRVNCCPCISADGLELYFQREEGNLQGEIYVARRPTLDSAWGEPVKLGPLINTSNYEGGPSISADGLSLYYGGGANGELFVTKRATLKDDWGPPVNLGPAVNSAFAFGASVSSDELELYLHSDRPGGYGGASDIWVTTRATVNDPWRAPVNLGPLINSARMDNWPGITPDGLVLFFSSNRPGGYHSIDVYMARRATPKDPWGPPVNVGPVINFAPMTVHAKVSSDGATLYFCPFGVDGSAAIWQAPILPIVDFNGDGKVDATDMTLLVANWGKNTSLCDIGPFAWGDGVVDEKDLKVLMEHLMTPGPKASDIPCDVVLSWISPSIAKSSDVYLGTSFEAVSTADRDHPLDVLGSWGQLETTYTPEKPLEFGRTYYWRIDTVLGSSDTSICKGPVLSFTTESFAHPIKNIIATASSSQPSMGPEKTVNGSGLDKNDGHSTGAADMWLSAGTKPHWIQYEFDQVYALHELWVWNSNQPVEPYAGFGAKTVKIEHSTNGTTWTPLADVPEFARASGQSGYKVNTTVSFGGVSAKYVRLTIEKGWGAMPSVGLSEVRFFCLTDGPATKP